MAEFSAEVRGLGLGRFLPGPALKMAQYRFMFRSFRTQPQMWMR
jgi:hypothetical protein